MTKVGTRRKVSKNTHDILIVDADAQDRTLTPQLFIESRCKVVSSGLEEGKTYLDRMSSVNESAFPGVQAERERCLNRLAGLVKEHIVLKRSGKGLTDDMDDVIKAIKKQNSEAAATDHDLLAQAYTTSLSQHFYGMKRQKKMNFNPSKSRKAVVEYYGANGELEGYETVHCHLLGKRPTKEVKAAHIIPKALKDRICDYLFESEKRNLRAGPKNSLLLHEDIAEAMERGQVAVIPLPTKEDEPTRWKCVLIDKSIAKKMILPRIDADGKIVQFRDIENKELEFSNDNRPARRFLYLRFVVSLIQFKKANSDSEMMQLMARLALGSEACCLWPLPGEYLRKSTLQLLTRSISGLELPEAMVRTTTFEDENSIPDKDAMDMECLVGVNHATNG